MIEVSRVSWGLVLVLRNGTKMPTMSWLPNRHADDVLDAWPKACATTAMFTQWRSCVWPSLRSNINWSNYRNRINWLYHVGSHMKTCISALIKAWSSCPCLENQLVPTCTMAVCHIPDCNMSNSQNMYTTVHARQHHTHMFTTFVDSRITFVNSQPLSILTTFVDSYE